MKTQKVYRYWIGKSDNKIHKSICEMEVLYKNNETFYCIHGDKSEFISKEDFDKKMLQRSFGLSVYFYKENDELAKKHFAWAVKEQLEKTKEQVRRYEEILSRL